MCVDSMAKWKYPRYCDLSIDINEARVSMEIHRRCSVFIIFAVIVLLSLFPVAIVVLLLMNLSRMSVNVFKWLNSVERNTHIFLKKIWCFWQKSSNCVMICMNLDKSCSISQNECWWCKSIYLGLNAIMLKDEHIFH